MIRDWISLAAFNDFVSGGVAGAMALIVGQPLDIVRVRMQQAASSGCKKGTVTVMAELIRNEGLISLYKGLSLPLAFASLQSAILFQSYGSAMRYLGETNGLGVSTSSSAKSHSDDSCTSSSGVASSVPSSSSSTSASTSGGVSHHPSMWHSLAAGSYAGFVQVFLWSPIELLKLRAQLQRPSLRSTTYSSPTQILKQIVRSEGITGLYRGLTVTALRDIPGYGGYFMFYNIFTRAMDPTVHPDNANGAIQLASGGLAGMVSWLPPVYTLDTIKTQMQATTRTADPGKTWWHYGLNIHNHGGWSAFNKGMAPTMARSFLVDGCQFVGYNFMLHTLVWTQRKYGITTEEAVHSNTHERSEQYT